MSGRLTIDERIAYKIDAHRYWVISGLPKQRDTEIEAVTILERWGIPHDELIEDAVCFAH